LSGWIEASSAAVSLLGMNFARVSRSASVDNVGLLFDSHVFAARCMADNPATSWTHPLRTVKNWIACEQLFR